MPKSSPIAIAIVIQNPCGFFDCDCEDFWLSLSLLPCILVSQFHMETQASSMDLTPSFPASSFSQFSRELSLVYERMAKTHSHQKFVSICVRDHIIPKGLHIKTQPCVPKSPCRELASRLQKKLDTDNRKNL